VENARFRELMHTVWTKDFLVIVRPGATPADVRHRFNAQAYSLKDFRLDFSETGGSEMEALEAVARRLGILPPLPPVAGAPPPPSVQKPRGREGPAEGSAPGHPTSILPPAIAA
jgi:hypothetical protein